MEVGAFLVKGEKIIGLVDAVSNSFSAWKYVSTSGNSQILVLEEYYFRIDSNLAVFIVFDLEDSTSCRIDIVVAGGGHGLVQWSYGAEFSMLSKIQDFIKEYAKLNGLRIEKVDTKLRSPGPGPGFKKCVKCGMNIHTAYETCGYCGARQP